MSHKRLCVKTLFDRAQLYCSDGKTVALEHSYLFNMFRSCGYRLSFIRRAMRHKIPRGHGQRENLTPEVPSEDQWTNQDSEPRWATLPYINGISETLARHPRSHNIKVTHKPMAALRNTLVKAKDTIPLEAKAGVIYQFPCKGCNAKYVGETGKTLKTRMKQHKAAIRNRSQPTSQPCTVWTQTTNSLLMKRKSLDRPKPKQAGYSWKLFIPMKTQLTDTSPLTLAMLL